MKVKIKVTKKDIKNGETASADACPIVLAVWRRLPNACQVYAQLTPRSGLDIESYRFRIPQKVRSFISDFDDGKKVKPFEFTINIEKECYDLWKRSFSDAKPKKKKA